MNPAAYALERLWSLTDQHRLAERKLTIRRPATPDAQIECWLEAHFGGPLLLVIGRGNTLGEAIAAAEAEVEAMHRFGKQRNEP